MTGARRKTDAPTVAIHPPNGYNTSMLKWLRSWFTWRFSLTRLVVAVVFLGVAMGLNMKEIGPFVVHKRYGGEDVAWVCRQWGWPLPVHTRVDVWERPPLPRNDPESVVAILIEWKERVRSLRSYRLPLSHLTYVPVAGGTYWAAFEREPLWLYRIIDALFALTVLTLILFLHPRSKPEGAK